MLQPVQTCRAPFFIGYSWDISFARFLSSDTSCELHKEAGQADFETQEFMFSFLKS